MSETTPFMQSATPLPAQATPLYQATPLHQATPMFISRTSASTKRKWSPQQPLSRGVSPGSTLVKIIIIIVVI